MRDIVELREFFATHRVTRSSGLHSPREDKLILCTLIEKKGSSYRGVGAKKIVSLTRSLSAGLLSGGCLEASIEKTARLRFAELPFTEKFSTLAEEDRLLGYQTGCQGEITLLFESMTLADIDLYLPFGAAKKAEGVAVDVNGGGTRFFTRKSEVPQGWFFDPWIQPVQLFVVGCGADAPVYLPLAQALGWEIAFMDHRSEFADPARFCGAKVRKVATNDLAREIPEGSNVAVILMTHNYEVDMEVVRGLRKHELGYLGCLGPVRRFLQIKEDLKRLYDETIGENLAQVTHAPAGIFPHSATAEEIALSVVTQIQHQLVETPRSRAWTLILAAGASRRFGGPKALAPWRNKTLIAHALETAEMVCGERVLVVTGGHHEMIQKHLDIRSLVFNDRWQSGIGTSIAAGVSEILSRDPRAETILILPVDQPLVTSKHLQTLLNDSRRSRRCALTVNKDAVVGSPAAVPKPLFDKALLLNDDRGLKSILSPGEWLGVEDTSALLDIDYPEDISRLGAENLF
jgi:molybdenum cofactor cytidylyltransferase